LALFAVKQVRSGRQVGCKLNVRDISSQHCQMVKGVSLQRLDRYDRKEESWKEVVVEDRHVGPAEVVATKLDFEAWAAGETTTRTARRFKVSAGRISQMRRELMGSWCEFVGDAAAMGGSVGAVA